MPRRRRSWCRGRPRVTLRRPPCRRAEEACSRGWPDLFVVVDDQDGLACDRGSLFHSSKPVEVVLICPEDKLGSRNSLGSIGQADLHLVTKCR
jgi:hypothetical protein